MKLFQELKQFKGGKMANNLSGKISQVLGAVVDVEFEGELPKFPEKKWFGNNA